MRKRTKITEIRYSYPTSNWNQRHRLLLCGNCNESFLSDQLYIL